MAMLFTGKRKLRSKMKYLNYINSFLKLVRWPNLIIIGAIQVALYYVIIGKIYKMAGITMALQPLFLALLIFTTLLIAGAGYIVNDYFDIRTDRINKPGKMIFGRKLKRKSGFRAQLIMNIFAVIAGFYLSFIAGSWRLGLIFPMLIMLLWLYSVKYKRMEVWGNVAISFLTAMVIMIVWLFEFFMLRQNAADFVAVVPYLGLITSYFGMFALFAFLLTFIREVLKDAEDIKGDAIAGIYTFAVRRGVSASVKLAMIITGLSAILVLYIAIVFFTKGMHLAGIYYAIAVFIPLVWFIYKIYKANDNSDFHLLSNLVKIVMIAGIIGLQPIAMSFS